LCAFIEKKLFVFKDFLNLGYEQLTGFARRNAVKVERNLPGTTEMPKQ